MHATAGLSSPFVVTVYVVAACALEANSAPALSAATGDESAAAPEHGGTTALPGQPTRLGTP